MLCYVIERLLSRGWEPKKSRKKFANEENNVRLRTKCGVRKSSKNKNSWDQKIQPKIKKKIVEIKENSENIFSLK